MPAGSEPLPLPRVYRPLGPRLAAVMAIIAIIAILGLLWFVGFSDATRARVTWLQRGTVIALFGLGIACLHAMARSRIEAHEDRLVVVNGYRRREFEWAQVIAARLAPGAPWVVLDLADGTTCSAMGIQGSDGARAKADVRELRTILAARS